MRPIESWLRSVGIILAALACAAPSLLSAAQCGPEPPPKNSAGAAFQRACDLREAGHYAEAIPYFQEAARQWRQLANAHWESRSLVYMGGCQTRLFQYRAALETTEAGAAIAQRAGEKAIASGADVTISTLFEELGNLTLARQKLEEAISGLRQLTRYDLLSQSYKALCSIQMRLGDVTAGIHSCDLAIQSAQRAQRPDLAARAWDTRGIALLKINRTKEAAVSLNTAVSIYQTTGSKRVPGIPLEHLAELKRHEKQYDQALIYIDQAFANADAQFKISPQFYPLTVRAAILSDLGRVNEALEAYRKAISSANVWRRSALPGDTTSIQTVQELNQTYHGFAELAAEQSLQHHDDTLAREAVEVLGQNRAAALREELAVDMDRNQALPAEYLAKLGELQSVQARITLTGDAASQTHLADLENEIAELETKIGLNAEKKSLFKENYPSKNSLRDIQSGLSSKEALLSFCLGQQRSFLWAITGETVKLYALPSAHDIGERASALRSALEHRQSFAAAARILNEDLFSRLDDAIWQKPEWLIVGDGALLDRVPFAILPGQSSDSGIIVTGHAVRLLPSEFLITRRSDSPAEARFLGVADPLYNLADSRRPQAAALKINSATARGSSALGRLPGSQREVRTSAKYSGMAHTALLIGADANLNALSTALSEHPAIVHFAVHVVSPPGHPEQAALALSLGKDNIPELLTREKIASLRVPGSLVVLSGCSSGQGVPVPSSGLIGLSRAWLLAGASAVVVSNWPVPDDSGQFFTSFYSHLSDTVSGPLGRRAAIALQRAQVEMQQRGGYGSAPNFWAAYSVVSKE